MKSVITISASLAISLMLCCTAQANDHKILGVIAMPRTDTNDIELKVPAGIDNGQVLRVSGQGDAGLNGGPNGDLNVSVNVRPHELLTRNGVDIYREIPITYAPAVLGAKETVPTLQGKVE